MIDKQYEEEYAKIKRDAYTYICDFADYLYPKTGRKVFEILSLMPVSLIIPDLNIDNKSVRSNIHCLFLAPSGSGKTSLAKLFARFTYNPLEVESITPAALERNLSENEVSSLIIGDFARMGRDLTIIKIIEGALGEEKQIIRETMRNKIDVNIECSALICGISSDLHYYILNGLIFRTIPILLGHNLEEHAQIGEHIMNKIGDSDIVSNANIREKVIKDYYMELAMIQDEKNKNDFQVIGYSFQKEHKDGLLNVWKDMTGKIVKEIGMNWFRELHEGLRTLVSHAFLNVYNRRVEKGILYPNEEDFKVALKIMKRNIIFKYRLMKSESMARGIRNSIEFNQIIKNSPDDYKVILSNLVKFSK